MEGEGTNPSILLSQVERDNEAEEVRRKRKWTQQ